MVSDYGIAVQLGWRVEGLAVGSLPRALAGWPASPRRLS